jgi:hypothetical protein
VRHVWFVLFLGGCNAILGIEEAIERPGDADGGPGDPGRDGSIDALDATAKADGTSPETDGSSATDAPIDSKVDSSADVVIPSGKCTVGAPVTASAGSGVTQGPALAFMPPNRWGIAWSTGSAIKYNSRTTTGTTANASDVTLLTGSYGSQVRLGKLGSSFIVAAGLTETNPRSIVRTVEPTAGGSGSGVPSGSHSFESPLLVGGLAVNGSGSRLLVSSRGGTLTAATATAADLFTNTPAFSKSGVPSGPARATAAAWAANLFGVVAVEATGAGKIATYDNDLSPSGVHSFTSTASASTSDTRLEISIAGAGARFAVAWIDVRKGGTSPEIWLTSIDAASGAPSSEVMVSDDKGTVKHYPRVIYDGKSIGVAWLEAISPIAFKVLFRRFTTSLQPLEPLTALCTSCTVNLANTAFDVAAGEANEYGFAFRSSTNDTQYFNRMLCDGP